MPFKIPNLGDASHADQAFLTSVDIDTMALGFKGNGVVTGCAVTAQSTPDMTVAVAAGTISWNTAEVTVTSGNVTITTAHATNPRRDLVVVSSTGVKSVVAGTPVAADPDDPSVVPVLPAVPANSIPLAAVDVPAATTAITNAEIIDKRLDAINANVPQGGQDISQFRNVGTTFERWYPTTLLSFASIVTTQANLQGAGVMHAVPYLAGRGGTLDRVRLVQSGTAAGNMRFGIYEATSNSNIYPNTLVADSGDISTSTSGNKDWTLSQALTANKLYWFVHLVNTASAGWYYAILTTTGNVGSPVLGVPATNPQSSGTALAIQHSQTYGALPSTCPSSSPTTNNSGYVFFLRYSA